MTKISHYPGGGRPQAPPPLNTPIIMTKLSSRKRFLLFYIYYEENMKEIFFYDTYAVKMQTNIHIE